MTIMRCEDVRQQLDDYVDGALAAEARAACDAHVVACADCAAELATLRRILQTARELPTGIAPRRDLWPDLAQKLEAHPVRSAPARQRGVHRRIWMPAYGFAAAAMLLVAVGLWMWIQPRGGGNGRGASEPLAQVQEGPAYTQGEIMPTVAVALERECVGASKMLQASVAGRNTASGAAMASSLTSGLDELDRSIAETRAALEQSPDDPRLMKLLTVRYQQKLALLYSAITFVEEV